MPKKHPKVDDVLGIFLLLLSSMTPSLIETGPEVAGLNKLNELVKECKNFLLKFKWDRLTEDYGPRNTELTVALMQKITELLAELFADSKILKPLKEWNNIEKGVFFAETLKMLAAQTHDFKILARIQARIKDVASYAHQHRGYLPILICLTAAALLLITLVIMSLLAAPLVAIPLVFLLGVVMKGLHAFMTLPDTHSNKVTEDQEITELCQALLKELNTVGKQMEDPTNKSTEKACYDHLIQQMKTQATKTVGKLTLPLMFFNPEKPETTAPVENAYAL